VQFRGYDLRGASEVVFEACSPTGVSVRFGVGANSTGMTIPIGTTFRT
jgi:hypothetical protein